MQKNIHRVDLDPDTDSEESTSKTDDEQDDPMTGGEDDQARGSHAEGSSSTQAGSAAQSQDTRCEQEWKRKARSN